MIAANIAGTLIATSTNSNSNNITSSEVVDRWNFPRVIRPTRSTPAIPANIAGTTVKSRVVMENVAVTTGQSHTGNIAGVPFNTAAKHHVISSDFTSDPDKLHLPGLSEAVPVVAASIAGTISTIFHLLVLLLFFIRFSLIY